MHRNIKVAPHMLKCKLKGANMPHKLIFAVVTIICLTLLMFTLLTRPSLCEVQYKSGVTEVAAYLACNVVR